MYLPRALDNPAALEAAELLARQGIDCGVLSEIGGKDDSDDFARIFPRSFFDEFGGAVFAAVIDQKDFIGLRQFVTGRNTAFDQFRQIQFLVVNGDDYGNHWFFFFHDPADFLFEVDCISDYSIIYVPCGENQSATGKKPVFYGRKNGVTP